MINDRCGKQRERTAEEQLAALPDIGDAVADHDSADTVYQTGTEASDECPEDRHAADILHQNDHILQKCKSDADCKGIGDQRAAVIGDHGRKVEDRERLDELLRDRRDRSRYIEHIVIEGFEQDAVQFGDKQAGEDTDHHEDHYASCLLLHQREHQSKGDRHTDQNDVTQVVHFFTPLSNTGTNASITAHCRTKTITMQTVGSAVLSTIISAMQR